MSRFPLDIEHYMSTALFVISPSQPISEAIRLMRQHDVRHLPVVTRQKVVGVISQRDIYLMRSLERSAPSDILVSEAMSSAPYTVEPDEPVHRVARQMVRRRIGTALVTHGNELLGMFTTTDALLALAALVEDERVPGEPQETEERSAAKQPTVRKRATKPAAKGRRPARRSKVAK